jgi:hypothetical protein
VKIIGFEKEILHNSTEDLLHDFYEILPDGLGSGAVNDASSLGIDAILSEVVGLINGNGARVISFLLMLLGLALLSRIAALPKGELGMVCEGAVGMISSFAILLALYPLFGEVASSIKTASDFFSSLMPIILSYLALGGGVTTAASTSATIQITIWVMGLIAEALSGIVVAMLAVSAIASLGENAVARVASGVRAGFSRLMGILLAILAGVLALQTYIAASADSATMRMAKHAAQSIIPVVGSAVAGALSTLSGGLSYAGSIIGGGAVSAILFISLSPIVILLLYKLCLYAAELLCDFSARGGGVSCFSAFSASLDALISVYTVSTVIYILDVIILVMGGERIFGGA